MLRHQTLNVAAPRSQTKRPTPALRPQVFVHEPCGQRGFLRVAQFAACKHELRVKRTRAPVGALAPLHLRPLVAFFFLHVPPAWARGMITPFGNANQYNSHSSAMTPPDLNHHTFPVIHGELHFQHLTRSRSQHSRPFFFICRDHANCCRLPRPSNLPIKMHIRIFNIPSIME